ncbi:C40 family peptidase [Pedomonas mirosovicensis]|uniref:C40 family peptidase n=1 Tax=Pedomonas mirosovicensis TaxID=2908641 RepID=UPI0021680C45|nr:C40 family peptidase [Pedomonas mirosovicensis]MCH8685767.1 C40 family peptidase [Pedomonas mirosovicensis]
MTRRSESLDLRVVAWRPDLADVRLYGQLAAHSYVEPAPATCRVPVAAVRRAPDREAEQISQLLLGETFHVLEIGETWAWGFCGHDRYVGYVEAACLDHAGQPHAPTHWVSAPQGLVFAAPSIKTALRLSVPLGARLALAEHDEKFFALMDGSGFIHRRHARPLDSWATDPVTVAEGLLGTPYLWGGRTRAGIDCSGLVQQALMACGIEAPRDSDQQQALGQPVPERDWSALRRGDIVFFPGHVGLMADESRLLHANAFWMSTVIEPLADVVERLKPDLEAPITCVRRLA